MLTERPAPPSAHRSPGSQTLVGAAARAPRRPDVTALHPALSVRYVELVAVVAPVVERALSPAVAANRVELARVRPPALRLAPWREERRRFAVRLGALARTAPCVVLADVRDCYGSITPAAVDRSLRGMGCGPGSAGAVRRFLERLEALLDGRGLPVGPDPSAVLANAVLARADLALARAGVRHLRWVDDVVAAVQDRPRAEAVVRILRAALRDVGLELNEAKTRVLVDPAAIRGGVDVSATRGAGPVR
jgi:hypothetical protein